MLCASVSASTQLQPPARRPTTPPALLAQPATCPPCFPTAPLFSSTLTESKAPPVRLCSRWHPYRAPTPPASAPMALTSPPPRPPLTSPGPETRALLPCRTSLRSRPPPTSTPRRQGAAAPEGTQTSSRFARARSLPYRKGIQFSHSRKDQPGQHSSPTLTWTRSHCSLSSVACFDRLFPGDCFALREGWIKTGGKLLRCCTGA